MLAFTTDSASNNITFMQTIETICKKEKIEFDSYHRHVRCIVHVMNLAVQDALAALKAGEAKDEDKLLEDAQEEQNVLKSSKIIPKVKTAELNPQIEMVSH